MLPIVEHKSLFKESTFLFSEYREEGDSFSFIVWHFHVASRNYPTFFPAVSHSITGHGKEEGYMSDINRLMRYRFQPLRHFVPPPLYFCIAKHPVALRGTAVEEGKYNPFHSLKIGSIPTKFLLSSNNRTLYSINKKIVSDY